MQAPFAAISCTFGTSPIMGFTLGGLKTNEKGQVLTASGAAVAGLYAAG